MKKLVSILVGLGAFYSQAQITLTQSNTPHNPTYEDFRHFNDAGITIPIEGANQLYDYSTLPATTNSETFEYLPATRPGFTDFTRYFVGEVAVSNIPLLTEGYTVSKATGIYYVGTHMFHQTVNLLQITGSATDSIVFTGGDNIFATPSPLLPFPNTFGSAASSQFSLETNFELTVSSYGLAQTPGVDIELVTSNVETVGYGKLILPMGDGQSIPYDVLLVKTQKLIVDSVFLGGAPAPAPLLTAFGMIQGDTTYDHVYDFYAADFENPLLTIVMSDDWSTPIFSSYDTTYLQRNTQLGLGKNKLSDKFEVYPNPASEKITISSTLKTGSEAQISIIDLFGKVVKQINTSELNSGFPDFQLDVKDLSNGTYFVKVNVESESFTTKINILK